MATFQETGGYDVEFVEDPIPEEFLCPICLLVIKDPYLTSCCGNHFCHTCIDPILQGGNPCPSCRDESFTMLLNKHHKRKICELKVRCPRKQDGCMWVGTLAGIQEHLVGQCLYEEVSCPNDCGLHFVRHKLENHLGNLCPKRQYTCIYCKLEYTYERVTQEHIKQCPNYPVLCPNNCKVGTVDRCCLEQHLCVCPRQPVKCQFSHAGCTEMITRRDFEVHMKENIQEHLAMISALTYQLSTEMRIQDQQITTLQADLQNKDKQIVKLQHDVESLECLVPVLPVEVTMENFKALKSTDSEWNSLPFYTHPRGYKLCLRIIPNGFGSGKDWYISVFLCAVKGEFDEHLMWPTVVSVRIQLLNQHNDPKANSEGDLERHHVVTLHRVKNRAIGGGQGSTKFAPHSMLPYQYQPEISRDTEYLKYDRLNFRIILVKCCTPLAPITTRDRQSRNNEDVAS